MGSEAIAQVRPGSRSLALLRAEGGQGRWIAQVSVEHSGSPKMEATVPLLSSDPEANPTRNSRAQGQEAAWPTTQATAGGLGNWVRAGRERGAPWEAGDHWACPAPRPPLRSTGAARARGASG